MFSFKTTVIVIELNNYILIVYFSLPQPIFIALSNVWTGFQDETVLIGILTNLTANLERFLGTHDVLFPEKVIQDLLDEVIVKTDMFRLKEHLGSRNHLLFPLPLKITSRIKSLFCFKFFILYLSYKVINIFLDYKNIENLENKNM